MRILALLALIVTPVLASPIPLGDCGSGTMDEYVALGSDGCEFAGYMFSHFTFSADIDGTPLSAADVTVSFAFNNDPIRSVPGFLGYWFGFLAEANWQAGPNELLTIQWGYAVAGGEIWGHAANFKIPAGPRTVNGGPTTMTQSFDHCRNGFFEPTCSGQFFPTEHNASREYDPALTSIAILSQNTWTSTEGLGQGGLAQFTGLAQFAPTDSVPEPGTWAIVATGLAVIATARRSRRRIQSSR